MQRAPQELGRSRRLRRRAVPECEGNEAWRDGRWEVGVTHCTDEVGEPRREGPGGGKGSPCNRTVGRNDGRDAELRNCLNETRTDSKTSERSTRHGAAHARALHRRRMVEGGARSHPEGRGDGRRRSNSRRVRTRPGRKPSLATQASEGGDISGPTGPPGQHPERRRANTPDRNTNLRG